VPGFPLQFGVAISGPTGQGSALDCGSACRSAWMPDAGGNLTSTALSFTLARPVPVHSEGGCVCLGHFPGGMLGRMTMALDPEPDSVGFPCPDALQRVRQGLPGDARVAVVLGSGFARWIEGFVETGRIPYHKIPGMPVGRVSGHEQALLEIRVSGVPMWVLSGRCHHYEGYSLEELGRPMRLLAALGVRTVLLTNAAGGMADWMKPGDWMVISDHMNFMGGNPLRSSGPSPGGLTPFVDMSRIYPANLQEDLLRALSACGAHARPGVYLAVSGPSYETPAEIRAFRSWGADAVGMSTVPEAMVAHACGLRVAGLSCITNRAAGLDGGQDTLSHDEVLREGRRHTSLGRSLLQILAPLWHPESGPSGPTSPAGGNGQGLVS